MLTLHSEQPLSLAKLNELDVVLSTQNSTGINLLYIDKQISDTRPLQA